VYGPEASGTGAARMRGDAEFGAWLFAIALLPRLWVALSWAGEAVWDGHYYDFGARRIAAGFGYSEDRTADGHLVWHPWCHYPVGYSGFLAMFYRVLGPGYATSAVANALVGAALALVTWALAGHALSTGRARVAGLIVALHPGLVLYSALVMSEPLAALLTLAAFWLAVRDARAFRGFLPGALLLGVAALVRPQALLCAPFLAFAVPADVGRRGRICCAAAACAVALVPVLPWTARNCRVMDGCALVSTNAGWNLAIGAFPRATGRFETLRSSDGCRDVTGQVQQDRCWLDYGLQQIGQRPVRWLSLVPAKLGYTFDHESFAVEYLHEAHPASWPEARRVAMRGLTTLVHRLLVVMAALGGVAFPLMRRLRGAATQGALVAAVGALGLLAVTSDSPAFWPLVGFATVLPWVPLPGAPEVTPALRLATSLLATTLITHAVFFGEDRYHIVVTPVLALLAAGALRRRAIASVGTRAIDLAAREKPSRGPRFGAWLC
jgi:4-amino-4-deoxy-L-arabinose transferase-like glycosyltransferase